MAVPGTFDDRAVNTKRVLNPWERNENHTLCLNSAKAIGCTVVNVGTQDFIEGRVCIHEMCSNPLLYQLDILVAMLQYLNFETFSYLKLRVCPSA